MDSSPDIHDEGDPHADEFAIGRLAVWLLQQLAPKTVDLPAFVVNLKTAFLTGLLIHHPSAGTWFATLETISPEDHQVAALVRLSRQRPSISSGPVTGMIASGQRGREPFATAIPAGDDFRLTYSFLSMLSSEKNLELFREFALNEIGRLRGSPEESRYLDSTDTDSQQATA